MERSRSEEHKLSGDLQEENSIRARLKRNSPDFSSATLRRLAFMEQGRNRS